MAIYQLDEHRPEVAASAWVADSAEVIGRVRLAENVSVWFQAVLRGDSEQLDIGPGCNIQDGSVLHADHGFPLRLEAGVTVGHKVMLHGCSVGENSLIGIGAVLLNGARIGRDSIVGAGALVTEGKAFPDGSLIVGSPAKLLRPLTPEQIEGLRASARHYIANGQRYARGLKNISIEESSSHE